jgi:hypothetical protein
VHLIAFAVSRNLSNGRRLAPLPKPHEEISDVFHGALAAANCGNGHQLDRQSAPRLSCCKCRAELSLFVAVLALAILLF